MWVSIIYQLILRAVSWTRREVRVWLVCITEWFEGAKLVDFVIGKAVTVWNFLTNCLTVKSRSHILDATVNSWNVPAIPVVAISKAVGCRPCNVSCCCGLYNNFSWWACLWSRYECWIGLVSMSRLKGTDLVLFVIGKKITIWNLLTNCLTILSWFNLRNSTVHFGQVRSIPVVVVSKTIWR